MKIYKNMPHDLLGNWPSEEVPHPPGSEPVDFHYHDVEEWLEVLDGTVTFFTVGPRPYALAAGEALNIRRGEVHRAEIGPEGVKYRMWLPVDMSGKTFQHQLDGEDMALVRKNLELPERENRWDKRSPNAPVAGNPDRELLDNFTSAELIFRTGKGKFLTKDGYLQRPPAPLIRTSSDTIRILYKDTDQALLSTVVETQSKETGTREFYSNTRLFVREEGSWMCRVWMNFPELVSS